MSSNTGIPMSATKMIAASGAGFQAAFRADVLAGMLPSGSSTQVAATNQLLMVTPSRRYRGRKFVHSTVVSAAINDIDASVAAAILNKDAVILATGISGSNILVFIGFYTI